MNTFGIKYARHFTTGQASGRTPYDEVQWETRTATIGNDKGAVIFEQREIEVPADWSQTASNIVASKYFYGKLGSPERERSVAQLAHRVIDTITEWGFAGRYFATRQAAENFRDELAHIVLFQKASFNSPVWFNVGVKESAGHGWFYDRTSEQIKILASEVRPQCSACFIVSVSDSLASVLDLAKTEGMLFKWGSGTGLNLSALREADATLSGGGRASGPLAFMKGFDAFAGVIKSGGKTRRAAKMVILNVEHPDIRDFIWCKAKEEKKAHVLIEAGYDSSFDGEAYASIFFQNANNSVRVTDEFMQAVLDGSEFWTKSVGTKEKKNRYMARDLMRDIAEATWQCGDPGLQFDTTINRWHTCKGTDRINASNPCSEYMFLDDSACNLSSLNLMKFTTAGGQFDVEAFRHTVDTLIVAQDILIDNAAYPTELIAKNSHDYRPLGLGLANLGTLLMSFGIPYDSDQGRHWSAAISAVMCGQAYLSSARIAASMGPFPGYRRNEQSFREVIRMHQDSVSGIDHSRIPADLFHSATRVWEEACAMGSAHGYRNAQVTVIAPTGTIGFMMDVDTTGIEPDLSLLKYRKMVGGEFIKIVNNTVPQALIRLGYSAEQTDTIVSHIEATGTIEGAPGLNRDHLPVFDCSFRPWNGVRSIHYMGHLKMMGAVQPFVSGAISKTINMHEECTVEDVTEAYIESWRLGLKAVAIYRDNSKKVQPLRKAQKKETATPEEPAIEKVIYRSVRRELPDEHAAIVHRFAIRGHENCLTVGLYDDGRPGEVLIQVAREDSSMSGLMDAFALLVTDALQHGITLRFLIDRFSGIRFEPSGWTRNAALPFATSAIDYVFRWLGARFVGLDGDAAENTSDALGLEDAAQGFVSRSIDVSGAPECTECGDMMTRSGSCYKCDNCGGTSGCS